MHSSQQFRALPSAQPAGSPSSPPAGNPIQAIYEKITARQWDGAGYEIKHTATLDDVKSQMRRLLDLITERKAEIDAGVQSGRDVRVIDQMRGEWMRMAQNYDEASDMLAALEPLAMAAE